MSAAHTEFGGTYAFDWATLPTSLTSAVVDGTAEVAACELDESDQTVRQNRDTGAYWQPATIWRATRAGITLLKIRRELRQVGAKQFALTGGCDLDRTDFYPVTAPPSRRHGVVTEKASAAPAKDGSVPASGAAPEHADYLPAPVRAELKALVSQPKYEHSTFVQFSSGTSQMPYRHRLLVMRMDAQRAVVVVAAREAETLPTGCTVEQAQAIVSRLSWDVTRFSYALSPASAAAGRPKVQGATQPELR